jgi:dienelactone hydrolase
MRQVFSFFSIVFIFNSLSAQFVVGERDLIFTDPARAGRQVPMKIWYPASTAGMNTTPANGSFPILIIGHGFLTNVGPYRNFADSLVPQGYVIGVPATETSAAPNHLTFGKDLLFAGREMVRQGSQESGFFLFQKLNGRFGLSGHSMGGGATFLAGAEDVAQTASCLIGYAPAITNPSSATAALSVAIPALILAGEADRVTPPATNQQPIFDNLTGCKALVTIQGGGHCFFMNPDIPCDFGETTSGSPITITRATHQARQFSVLRPWLDYFLKQDASAWNRFLQASSGTGLTSNIVCQPVGLAGSEDWTPTIVGRTFFLGTGATTLRVFDVTGRLLWEKTGMTQEGEIWTLPDTVTSGPKVIQMSQGAHQFSKTIHIP